MDRSAGIEKARLLLQAKRPNEALEVLAREPQGGMADLLRAWALAQMGYLTRALKQTELTIRSTPDLAEAHTLRSLILFALDRARAALKAGREAVRLDPKDAIAHAARGRAAVAWGAWKEAEAAATEAIRLAPHWTDGYLVMGALEMKLGHKKKAEEWFREAVRVDPSDAIALNDLARCLAKQRRHAEARALSETAARTDPSAEEVLDNLYRQTFHHVSGRGPADRLDIWFLPPFFALIAIDAAIFLGWLRPPAIASAVAFGLTVLVGVVYAVFDSVRNRRRLISMSTPAQMNFRRRFWPDWRKTFGFFLYFFLTCLLPGVIASIVVQEMGAPESAQWAVLGVVVLVWVPTGGFAWLAFLLPRLVRGA